jgi:N-acetylneuraminic acid mutarotase
MIVFGGKEGFYSRNYFNDTYSFDLEKMKWQKLDTSGDVPSIRCWHSAVTCGHSMLIFGGFYITNSETYYNDVRLLNLKTLHWTEMNTTGDIPAKRNRSSALLVEVMMY